MGLRVNLRKCMLGQLEIKYLGFLVCQGQIKPLINKVETIRNYEIPSDKCACS